MAAHDDRAAEAPRHLADELAYLVDAGGVEAVGGLVQEHQPGVPHERGGDAEPLLHAEGEVADELSLRFGVVEAHHLEDLVDAARRKPTQAPHNLEVLARREVRVAARGLDERTDAAQYREAVGRRHPLTQHHGGTGARVHEPQQHLHRGGLACTVWAQEPVDRALRYGKLHVVDHCGIAVTLGETLGGYRKSLARRRMGGRRRSGGRDRTHHRPSSRDRIHRRPSSRDRIHRRLSSRDRAHRRLGARTRRPRRRMAQSLRIHALIPSRTCRSSSERLHSFARGTRQEGQHAE